MGFIGGAIRAFSNNDPRVISRVKNPAIGKLINGQIGDYSNLKSQGESSLGDYISQYLANNASARTNVGQETGAIDQFYNGGMSNTLANLRNRRASAVNAAADLGAAQGISAAKGSLLASDGGGGSYADRLMMRAVQPYRVQAALDNSNQERADTEYVTGNQLSLAGRRTALADAMAARSLVPQQARQNLFTQENQNIAGLTNLDQANTFYGLRTPKNPWADFADSADAGILNAASIYSSVGGGMGAATGGEVVGPGSEHSDSIPIKVSKGEFVMPASAVKIPGVLPLLHRIRMAGLALELKHPEHFGRRNATGFWKGGLVYGYADGGMVDWMGGDGTDFGDFGGGGGGMGEMGGKKMGGGGGGLAGSAQQLNARSTADQTAAWMPATFVPMVGAGAGASGGGGGGFSSLIPQSPTVTGTNPPPPTKTSVESHFENIYGREAVPDNFGTLNPSQQLQYFNAYAQAQAERDQWARQGIGNPYE